MLRGRHGLASVWVHRHWQLLLRILCTVKSIIDSYSLALKQYSPLGFQSGGLLRYSLSVLAGVVLLKRSYATSKVITNRIEYRPGLVVRAERLVNM